MQMSKIKNKIFEFEKYLRLNEKSENTVEKYLRDVLYFLNFCKCKINNNKMKEDFKIDIKKLKSKIYLINDDLEYAKHPSFWTKLKEMCKISKTKLLFLDKNLIIEFKNSLTEKFKLSSANSIISSVNCYLKFLGLSELVMSQFKFQKNVFCSKEKELSKLDFNKLVENAKEQKNERLALILQTICGTGIRIGELKFITVEAVRKGDAIVSSKGKTRMVFIVEKLKNLLLNYINKNKIKSGSVFVTKNGNPINRSNVWKEMKGLCEKSGVDHAKVFPHNLRHLFAKTFYEIEKDIAKLADLLGHSSINTTRIYIQTSGEEHRKKMEKMKLIQ